MKRERYAEAKQLFLRAAELEAGEREAFVRRECRENKELQEEVVSLLRHHDTRTLLATPQEATRVERSRPRRRAAPRQLQPRERSRLGRWTRALGPGGQLALSLALAALLLGIVGFITTSVTTRRIRQLRTRMLADLLLTNVEALEVWAEQEQERVQAGARDREFRRLVARLVEACQGASAEEMRRSPLQAELRDDLNETFGTEVRFALWDEQGRTIADWSPQGTGVGDGVTDYGAALLERIFAGQTVLQMPGDREPITAGYPIAKRQYPIAVIAPVRDERSGTVIAALLVYGIGAETRFQRLLSILQPGETGETYAFNEQGVMISESRFPGQLRAVGLLPEEPSARSTLQLRLADPGGDLTRGFRPRIPRDRWPLTRMARAALNGEDGADGYGYRDYRGVKVIGAWHWLAPHGFGVATEVDYAEAFEDFRFVNWELGMLYALFALALAGVVGSYTAARRAQRRLREARRVGPYKIEYLLGEGGMGEVYLARHALLKRPTALKLLKTEIINPTTLAWFEREVQLASQLTHPNTIQIYDYGHTEDGVFYYAMEYLPGITLEDLVRRHGPLPASRVVYLWRQVCLSLREAHAKGLIHRDIKPRNIMLCQLGGEDDVVKVLDFGLAKDAAAESDGSSATLRLAGTPRYMAPERFINPLQTDARVDIYACGVVAFKLLTGQDVCSSENDVEAMLQSFVSPAPRPSARLGQPIDPRLDTLVQACLAPDPDDRPPDVQHILEVLDHLHFAPPWDSAAARSWWQQHEPPVA